MGAEGIRGRSRRRHWTAGKTSLKLAKVSGQHRQHVVQHVASAWTPLSQIRLCQQAERLAVHLEHVHVELG